MVHSTHDALFRRLFADRSIAAPALAATLPAEVAQRIDFATLELQPTSHVDEALHAFHSDLVFTARIAGREGRLLLLLEHQSSTDALMPFRLLQYAVLLWDGFLRDNPHAHKLPVIVPVVWHHGPSEWRAPRDMLDVLDLTTVERVIFGRYAPRMRFELEEIGQLTDAQLRDRSMPADATLALAALRDVREATDVTDALAGWIRLVRDAAQSDPGKRAVAAILRYILEVHAGLDVDELANIADDELHGTGATIMTTAQELIDRGRAEGEARGRADGEARGLLAGRRATIARQLQLKFRTAFTDALRARVEAADAATLDVWEERILSATSIDELLGSSAEPAREP